MSRKATTENEHRSLVGPIIGGVAGGLLGAQVGKGSGRVVAAAAGATVGAIVGDRLGNRDRGRQVVYQQEVRRCRMVDQWETRISGYRVVYEYGGRSYTTVLPVRSGPPAGGAGERDPVAGRLETRCWSAAGRAGSACQAAGTGLRGEAAWAIISAMNSAKRSRTFLMLALVLASLCGHRRMRTADAGRKQPKRPHDFAPHQLAQQRISIEQAIAIVQRETGGKVLDARAQGQQYRIKVLTRGGEVRVVYVDAATGATR